MTLTDASQYDTQNDQVSPKELEPKHDSSTKMKPYNSWNMHVNMRNSENEMSSVL